MGFKLEYNWPCLECGEIDVLNYKSYWYRKNVGTGCCNKCSRAGGNKASFKRGNNPWNKGMKGYGKWVKWHPKEDKNPSWKGDDCSYTALHQWVSRKNGKAVKCGKCGKSGKGTWANISREYKRSLDDFVSLCYSCHKYYDLGKISL